MNRIRAERPMRIVCIGAGASGLCFAYKLQRSFDNFTLTLYERQNKVGGVWASNRYPGCACDYESHNYTFSWEPKADWTSVYAPSQEVQRYFDDFAKKYELLQYCKFDTAVRKAQWDDDNGAWKLQLQCGETEYEDTCDILINASGLLSSPKWPEIRGLAEFNGLKIHSGTWPESPVEVAGKRVGLIGNGSSGQQLLGALQPHAGNLTVFIRQPTWVLGSFGPAPRSYSVEEIRHFESAPDMLLAKRKQFENRVNSYFSICLKDSPQQEALRRSLTQKIRDQLTGSKYGGDLERFIPDYAVGCRRPTPGAKYIESLCADNVSLVQGAISHITPNAVVDHQGNHHPLDMLICATGFDTTHKPNFPLIGRNGRNLQDIWASRAKAYLAIAVAELPNYFVFYGPNNPFGSGAFLSTVEAQADYMLKWCDRWQTENIHSFAPKQHAIDEFYEHADSILKDTVWSDRCGSWYKTSGPLGAVSLWPGSGLHYMEAVSTIQANDFDVQYHGNRWKWLGNGFSQVEEDPECDLSYYIRVQDDSEFLSSAKRRRAVTKGTRIDPKDLHIIG